MARKAATVVGVRVERVTIPFSYAASPVDDP